VSKRIKQDRKVTKEVAAIARKAKVEMSKWLASLLESPTEKEMRAWQAGYIAGINVGHQEK
jgi:post-segregation antitoxin (ccd killing protein)